MKYFTTILFCATLILGFIACGDSSHEGHGEDATHHEGAATDNSDGQIMPENSGPEYTSTYICPMHCEGSGSEEAGTCPVCGMDYVLRADHEGHEGHDHEGHEGHHNEGHDH